MGLRQGMLVLGVGLAAALAIGCGDDSDGQGTPTEAEPAAASDSGLPQGAERVRLDPADFTTEIDNPYWPMTPGDRASTASPTPREQSSGVPFGKFRNVLLIKETEGIERTLLDYKFYARGIGPVLGVEVSAGSGREELVSYSHGS